MEQIWQTLPLEMAEMICNKLPQVRSLPLQLKKELCDEQWRLTRVSKFWGQWYDNPWYNIIYNRLNHYLIHDSLNFSIICEAMYKNIGINIQPTDIHSQPRDKLLMLHCSSMIMLNKNTWETVCRNIWNVFSHEEKMNFSSIWPTAVSSDDDGI